jgi:hypothetical protein
MIVRILTSGWFAFLAVIAAGVSLFMLHSSGQTTEALIGSAVLLVATLLILIGGKKRPPPE